MNVSAATAITDGGLVVVSGISGSRIGRRFRGSRRSLSRMLRKVCATVLNDGLLGECFDQVFEHGSNHEEKVIGMPDDDVVAVKEGRVR